MTRVNVTPWSERLLHRAGRQPSPGGRQLEASAYILLTLREVDGEGTYTATLVAAGPAIPGAPVIARTIDHLHQLRNLQHDWDCDDVRGDDVLANLINPGASEVARRCGPPG